MVSALSGESKLGGGGGLPNERGGDACRKYWIKPLKDTNLGVAQPFWSLKETILNSDYMNRVIKRIEIHIF